MAIRKNGTVALFSLINRLLNKLSEAVRKTDDHFHVFPMAMFDYAFTATAMPRAIGFGTGAIFIDSIPCRAVDWHFIYHLHLVIFQSPTSL